MSQFFGVRFTRHLHVGFGLAACVADMVALRCAVGFFSAHRLAYEMTYGASIASGDVLDHLCKEKSCVNPSHLEPVSQQENVLRGRGACALNARKIVCPRCGLSYEGENLIVVEGKYRACRNCKRRDDRNRYYRDKKKRLAEIADRRKRKKGIYEQQASR